MAQQQSPGSRPRGAVVALQVDGSGHACEHDRATLAGLVQTLARLKGYEAAAPHDPARPRAGPVYYVPSETLTAMQAARLGVRGPDDLFGGVVPHGFVATKAISHALVAPGAEAPAGWSAEFAGQLGDMVLRGYTAFSTGDAQRAGLALLQGGPVRLKPVRATGGCGQTVARDARALQEQLAAMDRDEIAAHGLVLEEHLEDVRTFSVGQVQVDDLVASYHGTQSLTRSNSGAQVFGGSDLTVVRGDFEALLRLGVAPEVRHAIELARRFDAAVEACYPGFYASRRNYDVVRGRDAQGQVRSGVLEQSWRVGGASGPELAALEVLRREPSRTQVRATGTEVFGDSAEPPPHAIVHYRGTDPEVGPLTKYTVLDGDGHPR